ncbi:MAG: POTRA domain-containing protein [Planctomycetaceae bacterium]
MPAAHPRISDCGNLFFLPCLLGIVFWAIAENRVSADTAKVTATPGEPATMAQAASESLEKLKTLQIEGVSAFSSEEILAALRMDDHLRHPAVSKLPLPQFFDVVSERIAAGYIELAYYDVKTKVLPAAANSSEAAKPTEVSESESQPETGWKIQIQEGEQYKLGPVHIHGVSESVSNQLRRLIETGSGEPTPIIQDHTGKYSTDVLSFWTVGDPCALLDQKRQKATKLIEVWLDHNGFWFPEFQVRIDKNPTTRTQDLSVSFQETGGPITVNKVFVKGNKESSTEQILELLQLKPPFAYNEAVRNRIREQLTQSGRFSAVDVIPEIPFGPNQPIAVTIQVAESANFPGLGAPLSPEQSYALRISQWLNNWHTSDEDMVVRIGSYVTSSNPAEKTIYSSAHIINQMLLGTSPPQQIETTIVISPGKGFQIELQASSDDQHLLPARQLIFTEKFAQFQIADSHRPFLLSTRDTGIVAELGISQQFNPNGELQSHGKFDFAINVKRSPFFQCCLKTTPQLILSEIESIRPAGENGNLLEARFRTNNSTVVFDSQSGRIQSLEFYDEDIFGSIHLEPGALDRQVASLSSQLEEADVRERTTLGLTAIGRGLVLEYADRLRQDGRELDARLLEKLFNASLWSRINDVFVKMETQLSTASLIRTDGAMDDWMQDFDQIMKHGESISTSSDVDEAIVQGLLRIPETKELIRELVRTAQSLDQEEVERLATIIQQGEVFGAGKGINIRPICMALRSIDTTDDTTLEENLVPVVASGVKALQPADRPARRIHPASRSKRSGGFDIVPNSLKPDDQNKSKRDASSEKKNPTGTLKNVLTPTTLNGIIE